MSEHWTAENIPDLAGKVAVVTGANSGLGYITALELVRHGATVLLACRSADKANDAIGRIRAEVGQGEFSCVPLDLSSLASIRGFADRVGTEHPRIDLIVNNAGVMALPHRNTADGFEMQMGTNHFGHFALTGLLLPNLLAADSPRVVTVSSLMHKIGRIHFDDLDFEKRYDPWTAYGQSKLANLLFAYELQRRFEAKGVRAISVAAHPGYSATNLQRVGPEMSGQKFMLKLSNLANRIAAQEPKFGALPTLYAATAPSVEGGDFIGPDGFMETRGHPKKTQSNARSHDLEDAKRLWTISVERTGVRYEQLD